MSGAKRTAKGVSIKPIRADGSTCVSAWILAFAATLMVMAVTALPANAAELKVLTAGAFKQVVVALVPLFVQRTGHTVTLENDTAGALARRIADGAPFDLVILTPPSPLSAASNNSGRLYLRHTRLRISIRPRAVPAVFI